MSKSAKAWLQWQRAAAANNARMMVHYAKLYVKYLRDELCC